MTLLNHFDQPIDDSQRAFRQILKALSEPGIQVTLPHRQGWKELNPAATSVLLTLADQETAVYLDGDLNNDLIRQNLRFHTGAPEAIATQQAVFAVFRHHIAAEQLEICPTGDEVSPELSVTLIIQVDNLQQGTPLHLRGPGIEEQRQIAPHLPAAILNYLINRPNTFPTGMDVLLACGEDLMAIPRTTQVEVR
ncbi:carbon-phosphorus lyase complex subunit [Yersinia entomophaga]|uniref:Carbon-phosphorus lyase complex subunit n=1 Tax=Yersinia entomophaga TaxID=935293 RepID=A0ABM6BM28_YERET|nr:MULTISPECIES: phosphonate C-P lyase system protein PhnH [Yersinia]ANI30780.1 carbon-phosphorus lyase complex subunit [Yersinia entomophaga]OWF88959.1 phosphonate C-P lyase system protein PhnH [Yersinia entomophaga]